MKQLDLLGEMALIFVGHFGVEGLQGGKGLVGHRALAQGLGAFEILMQPMADEIHVIVQRLFGLLPDRALGMLDPFESLFLEPVFPLGEGPVGKRGHHHLGEIERCWCGLSRHDVPLCC